MFMEAHRVYGSIPCLWKHTVKMAILILLPPSTIFHLTSTAVLHCTFVTPIGMILSNFINTRDPAFCNLRGAMEVRIDNFDQNFTIKNYVGKQVAEVDVDAVVHETKLNELLLIDNSTCFES